MVNTKSKFTKQKFRIITKKWNIGTMALRLLEDATTDETKRSKAAGDKTYYEKLTDSGQLTRGRLDYHRWDFDNAIRLIRLIILTLVFYTILNILLNLGSKVFFWTSNK